MVAITIEPAVVKDMLCAMMTMMPLMMPFIQGSFWHVPADLTRDTGSMLLGASLLQGSHCGSNCN